MSTILILFGLILMALLWALVCNERTYRQRHRLADVVFSSGDWRRLADHLEAVSYDRHLRTLFWGGDAYRLYHADVRALLPERA